MITFESTKTVPSKKFEGVQYKIRIPTEAVRTKIQLDLADTLMEIRVVQADMESIQLPTDAEGKVDYKAASRHDIAKLVSFTDKIERLRRTQVDRSYVETFFVGVTGLSLDGETNPSAESIRVYAPDAVYRELAEIIRIEAEMTEAERENLGSPTTFPALVAGQTSVTTAEPVETKDYTVIETADDSSPVTWTPTGPDGGKQNIQPIKAQ